MEAERPDSLEGWVSIRSGLFTEVERPRLRFLVAWNEVEGKFAVTCHSRPLQARSADTEAPSSWAALYSPRDLHGIHRVLVASCTALEHCFPAMPELRPPGLWGLLFPDLSLAEPVPDLHSVCRQLELYLDAAVELCGHRIATDVLFPEDDDDDEVYFESVSEFRGRSLEQLVAGGREALRKILYQHRNAKNMVTLKRLYQEEDEAYEELVTAATQFYQCLLQPFRDMREFASLCKQEALKSLEFDTLGPRRIQSLQKEVEEWSRRMHDAICSIQDITVDYFQETVKALAAMQKQMEEDQNHFGKAAWASVAPRLEKLKFMYAKETLQHTRAKELCLKHKKAQIQCKIRHLDTKIAVETVDELEMQYYETQLELYNIQLEMLKYEELLVVAQLDTIRREIREKEEEVVYYDACEDPEQLQANEGMGLIHDSRSVDIKKLLRKAHHLETKRGAIGSRRSYLRNKRDQCKETQKGKQQQLQGEEVRFQQHHSIQLKRDQQKEEHKRRREWVNVERQKTLQRLRQFKEKSSGQIVFKPRGQTLRAQREETASNEQPISIAEHPTSKKQSRISKGSSKIPVQIFLTAAPISPGQVETREISSETPSTPVPPPPPLPPPPLPPSGLSSKGTSGTKEQLLVFTAENSAKKSLKEHIGTMDDVLASLKRGEALLKKVDQTKVQSAEKPKSLQESLLAEIRRGVPLRKVRVGVDPHLDNDPATELERSIKAAMERMKKVSSESDDEGEDVQSGEWDS